MSGAGRSAPTTEASLRCGGEVLLDDRFDDDREQGDVVGTFATSGQQRLGRDRWNVIGIDDGRLRIGWFPYEGAGQTCVAYGPFDDPAGLTLVVRAMNGLTTSQSDPRPEGGRAKLSRWRATFPHGSVRQPKVRDSLLIGWYEHAVSAEPSVPIAGLVHRAGPLETGELWFHVGSRGVCVNESLQNIPAVYAIGLADGHATLHAWSHPGATGFGDPASAEPLARLPIEDALPTVVYAAVHQQVIGEVDYRVDTRIDWVRVVRPDRPGAVLSQLEAAAWWSPMADATRFADAFDGPAGDLHQTPPGVGAGRWRRVMGAGTIERTGTGDARVVATVECPNPGRTAYCLPWPQGDGAVLSSRLTPPGTRRGEGHRGRSGVVFWQDVDNHLVVNHWIDDGFTGVSISAFLRLQGHEVMCEWDAVWTNVGDRVHWGVPFDLSVACDGTQFLAWVGGEPVLYRRFSDYRRGAPRLVLRGVGIVANWEWGDDTGTRFHNFRAQELRGNGPLEPVEAEP